MKRKLVKQGAATLMISIPSKWAKANNLDKGDEIDIQEKDSMLILSLNEQKLKEKEITINSLTESATRTILTSTYRAGYDRVTINYSDKEAIKLIEKVINNHLLGFETIKKDAKKCIVENITEPSVEQLENVFTKVFLNIDELFDLTLTKDLNSSFEETEQRIIKFDNFCRRVVAKTKPNNFHIQWAFQTALNHGQRELYHLIRYLHKSKAKMSNESRELLELTREAFLLLKKAYEEKNIDLLDKLHLKEHEIIYTKGYAVLKKKIDGITIHHILSAMRNFYLASSPLTTLLLERESSN